MKFMAYKSFINNHPYERLSVRKQKKKPLSLLNHKVIKVCTIITSCLTTKKEEQHIIPSSGGILPPELEANILLRLPAQHLARCRCVCKRWRDEIDGPMSIKSHPRQIQSGNSSIILYLQKCGPLSCKVFSMDFTSPDMSNVLACHRLCRTHTGDDTGASLNRVSYPAIPCLCPFLSLSSARCLTSRTELIGSSNGLLCFQTTKTTPKSAEVRSVKNISFCLYNPVTSTFHIMPHLVTRYNFEYTRMAGFGYDCTSDDYKILISVVSKNGNFSIRYVDYYVYSLKRNLWKKIHPSHKGYVTNDICPSMIFSNNALHFLGHHTLTSRFTRIYAFDLGTEEFHEVPQPYYDNDEDPVVTSASCGLTDVRGCLHLAKFIDPTRPNFYATAPEAKFEMRIWVMRKYGSKESWAKLIHSISLNQVLLDLRLKSCLLPRAFAYSEDGSEILLGICEEQYVEALVRCNLRTGELKKVQFFGFPHEFKKTLHCQVIPWSASSKTFSSSSTEE